MTTETLYHFSGSPNSRRVRMFLAEKGISLNLVEVDLGKGEQHSESYRAINPRRVVPTLVLEDGTAIGEVPAIQRYLEDTYSDKPLLGRTIKEKALIAMWDRRVEQEGFSSVIEAVRNFVPSLKGRAIAGPHDYEQIPALVERSKLRLANFFHDLNTRLEASRFIAGDSYSVAEITALAVIDFAAKVIDFPVSADLTALKRWCADVAARPSATA
jgi:glutathione S-transferase